MKLSPSLTDEEFLVLDEPSKEERESEDEKDESEDEEESN